MPTVSWRSGCTFALLAGLLAACGSNANEKVDAGQRKYCDAYCSSHLDSGQRLDTGSGLDGGGQAIEVSAAGRPEASVADTLSSLGDAARTDGANVLPDGGAPSSDLRDGSATGATVGDAGDVGGVGVATLPGMDGGDAPSDPAPALGDALDVPAALPDLPTDVRSIDDARPDLVDAQPDLVDAQPDVVDAQPDVVDAPGDLTDAPSPDVTEAPGDQSASTSCQAAQPAAAWQAQTWPPNFGGMAFGAEGSLWVTGNFYSTPFAVKTATGSTTASYTGGGDSLHPSTDSDAYLVKLDPVTGLATVSKFFGQLAMPNSKNQSGTGVAVAPNGNVALIGTFETEIDFTSKDSSGTNGPTGKAGLDYLLATDPLDNFVVVLDPTGAPKQAYSANTTTRGVLHSVASNPNQAAFAVCGTTGDWLGGDIGDGVTNVDGSSWAGVQDPYGGDTDIVVAKIDAATGNVLWAREFGGTGDQGCQSVALDNNGDVIIAGGYRGTLQFGTLAAFPTVSDLTPSLLYLARLASADGRPLAAATWGSSGKTTPYGLVVDGSGNIIVAGSLGATLTMGSITLTDLGATDAFVAKLDASLAPVWGHSFGDAQYNQQAKSVAIAGNGDIDVAGLFIGSMGAMGLTSYSETNTDAFVAHLASDGSVVCAHVLGDSDGAQDSLSVAVAPTAAGTAAGSLTLAGGFANTLSFDHPSAGSTPILSTGSPSVTDSYVLRLAP